MSSEEPDYQLFSALRFDPLLLESPTNTALAGTPSPFYMLSYHRDRMLQAAQHFNWTDAASQISGAAGLERLLKTLQATIDVKSSTPLRVRTLLHYSGEITVEAGEVPKIPLDNLFPSRIPPPAASAMKVSPLTGGVLTLGENDSLISGTGEPEQKTPWTVLVDPKKTDPSPFTTYKTTCRDMYDAARSRAEIENFVEPREVLIISSADDEIMEGSRTSCFFWRNGRWVTPPISSGGQAGTTRRWLLEKGFCEEEAVIADSVIDGEECWLSNGVRGLMWGKVKL